MLPHRFPTNYIFLRCSCIHRGSRIHSLPYSQPAGIRVGAGGIPGVLQANRPRAAITRT